MTRDHQNVTYEDVVHDFDHEQLTRYRAYPQLRQALSDLANDIAEADGMTLADWLQAIRDFAATAPYGDMCTQCENPRGRAWPYAAEVSNGWIHGTYRCPAGHAWTCNYAVNIT